MIGKIPRLTNVLDITNPTEREVRDLVVGLVSGHFRTWVLLGVARHGDTLRLAVEWVRSDKRTFSVVDVTISSSLEMRATSAESAEAARAALDRPAGAR
jgi:hypothetical protein